MYIYLSYVFYLIKERVNVNVLYGSSLYITNEVLLLWFITSRNKGGGHKRLYRKIDFKRNKLGCYALVFVHHMYFNGLKFQSKANYDFGKNNSLFSK